MTDDTYEANGAALLDDLTVWFGRFIAVTNPDDLPLLALWDAHTYLTKELFTTPRLLIDSIMPSSGKTTVLDHLRALCRSPVQAASLTSPALIPRLLEVRPRTLLLDEVDRSLRPDRPGVEDLIGILNSGYRSGATRPVLIPAKGGGWDSHEMPTFAPVAMAGNSPHLPLDTLTRSIRILLMPDLRGTVEDSDWELIEDAAAKLKARIVEWTEEIREAVKHMSVELPKGCIGRSREKWRPLMRVAVAAGGHWPAITYRLIEANMAEDEAEREAGLKTLPPGMVVMIDLHAVWPHGETFMATKQLVSQLIAHNPEYWGLGSPYGKALTEHRLGRLVSQASKVTSCRPGGKGPRGYLRQQLDPVWHRLGIGHISSGESDETGESGEISGLTASAAFADLFTTPLRSGDDDTAACGSCGADLIDSASIILGRCQECQLTANNEEDTP